MQAAIDKAGRLMLPESPLPVEPIARGTLEERNGRLVIAESGIDLDDDLVREARAADQR